MVLQYNRILKNGIKNLVLWDRLEMCRNKSFCGLNLALCSSDGERDQEDGQEDGGTGGGGGGWRTGKCAE